MTGTGLLLVDLDVLLRQPGERFAQFVAPRVRELWSAARFATALGCSEPQWIAADDGLNIPSAARFIEGSSELQNQDAALQRFVEHGIGTVYLAGHFELFAFDGIVDRAEQLGLALRVVKDCCSFAAPDEVRVAYRNRESVNFLQSVEALTRLSPGTTATAWEGRYLRLYNRAGWEFVERTRGKEVVVIVPLFDGQIIFVEQYRAPLDRTIIELPAGLVGDNPLQQAESLELAAQRELLEETGFEAASLQWLTSGPCSAGLSNEVVHLFLATGLIRRNQGGGDETEEITTHIIAAADADAWLNAKISSDACLVDPKVYIGLYYADRHLRAAGR